MGVNVGGSIHISHVSVHGLRYQLMDDLAHKLYLLECDCRFRNFEPAETERLKAELTKGS